MLHLMLNRILGLDTVKNCLTLNKNVFSLFLFFSGVSSSASSLMILFLSPLVIFLECTKTPFKETKQTKRKLKFYFSKDYKGLLPPASHDVPDIWPVVEHGVQEGVHNVGHRGKVPQKQLEISSNLVEE